MLSREAAIDVLENKPNQKITHKFFDSNEYIYSKDGVVYDEQGYLFEDWVSDGTGKHDGIRARVGGAWEDGWSLYEEG